MSRNAQNYKNFVYFLVKHTNEQPKQHVKQHLDITCFASLTQIMHTKTAIALMKVEYYIVHQR